MSDWLPSGDEKDQIEGFDPDARALCSDDSCIGVLDGAGRCKVCGQPGTAAATGVQESQISPELPGLGVLITQPESSDPALGAVAPDLAADAEGDDFADRRLCADPGCIGVLDAAGRCKECGRVDGPAPSFS